MLLATKWACDRDRMEWKFLHSGRNIQPTALARDDELLSILHPTSQAGGTICEHMPLAGNWDSAVLSPTWPLISANARRAARNSVASTCNTEG
jgi:hypothetical protein